jgi:hypothetical protein
MIKCIYHFVSIVSISQPNFTLSAFTGDGLKVEVELIEVVADTTAHLHRLLQPCKALANLGRAAHVGLADVSLDVFIILKRKR